jgi:NAD(P)-dependent dehydrogenase (short-subunit alcohol dehydrogenase family)
VTDAATGIRRATAERLAQEGARVVGDHRRESAAKRHRLDTVLPDVRSEDAWGRAVAHAERRHGGLDILVNNAGIRRLATALETTRDLWDGG